MAQDTPSAPVIASFTAVEANVLIAGLEAAVVAWTIYTRAAGVPIVPALDVAWHWWLALYGILAVLALVVVGLALEGLAGIIELLTTRRWWGPKRGQPWTWYANATALPSSWSQAQRWMWKSSEAFQEFARRRLRILVCRNTAFCFLALTIGLLATQAAFGLIALALVGFALFVFLWLSANRGWNTAVSDAGDIGPP